jgi:hypothetical protein
MLQISNISSFFGVEANCFKVPIKMPNEFIGFVFYLYRKSLL